MDFTSSLQERTQTQEDKAEANSYLENIRSTRQMVRDMQTLLGRIREDLGPMFVRLMYESIRLRSPQKPAKKKSVKSPYKRGPNPVFTSDGSISVPSRSEIRINDLSSKDFSTCVSTLIGMTATYELDCLKSTHDVKIQEMHNSTDNHINHMVKVIDNFINLSKDAFVKIDHVCEEYAKDLSVDKSIDASINMQEEINDGLNSVLNKLVKKSDFHTEDSYNFIKDLKNLEDLCGVTYKERCEISSIFAEEVNAFYKKLKQCNEDTLQYSNERKDYEQELEKEIGLFEEFTKEIDSLEISILSTQGKLFLQSEQQRKLESLESLSKAHSYSNNFLKTEIEAMSKHSSENTENAHTFHSETLENSDIIQTNVEKATKIQEEQLELSLKFSEDLDNATKSVEVLKNMLANYNSEEQIEKEDNYHLYIEELDYLSDYTLRWTHTGLSENRLLQQLKEVKAERNNELQVMARALGKVKEKFPVYHPDKSDPIDSALGTYLNQSTHKFTIPFIRIDIGVYLYGSRRVLLKVDCNKLQAKVGGGFLPIKRFIQSYENIEREKVENKIFEFSPTAKKFMGKWAETVIDENETNPKRMREHLLGAIGTPQGNVLAVKKC